MFFLKVEKQIISEFDDHLIGKPKLFIFQACRGCKLCFFFKFIKWNFFILAQGNIRPESTTSKSLWSLDGVTNENNQTNVDIGNYTITQVPIRRDMAIWYSTIKGSFIGYLIIKKRFLFF